MTALPRHAPPLAALGNRLSLFLDLDGVLATIEQHPSLVVPTPQRTALLRALSVRLDERLAIISGRPMSEIDHICEGTVSAVAGVHGLEMREPGGACARGYPDLPDEVIEQVLAFADRHPSVFVERKGVAIAIHYRNDPSIQSELSTMALKLAADRGLKLQSGHFVEEIRQQGADKGSALKAFMALPRFHGSTPVMLGDDHTDEAGFEAAQALGGTGIRVAPKDGTSAKYSLPTTEDVAPWLAAFVAGGT